MRGAVNDRIGPGWETKKRWSEINRHVLVTALVIVESRSRIVFSKRLDFTYYAGE